MISLSELRDRARAAQRLSAPCRLCPRECGVDRSAGERGFCGAGSELSVASVAAHFGEEPPLVGAGGAGAVFLPGCNMKCVYCQNHQISQQPAGNPITPEELAERMLALQAAGCVNIEWVSPSHYIPWLLDALLTAAERGLNVPLVYNTNAYEATETLDLLNGVVDIYLPDIKYASDEIASRYSSAAGYVDTSRTAIAQMHDQVGELTVDNDGIATRGLLLRHLVLPDNLSGSTETLLWIAENLPRTGAISLMYQYSPLHEAAKHPPLNRRVTREEYEEVIDVAWELGLENAFIQEEESRDSGIPDFRKETPFSWD